MRTKKKMLLAPTAVVALLALATGPAIADDATETDATECPAPTDDTAAPAEPVVPATVTEAATAASVAADDLADDDACSGGRSDRATAALQAALVRLSADGAGGNGVAAQVLQALLDGESPSGIGAAHGAAMAQAAKDRKAERVAARDDDTDEADGTGETEETVPVAPLDESTDPASDDGSGATPATPAISATPATPATDDGPAVPATPATPAVPAEPHGPKSHGSHGRPSDPGKP